LPPETTATASGSPARKAAATAAAPLGSATTRASENIHFTAGRHLCIVDRDDLIDEGLHVRERDVTGAQREQTIGDARRGLERDGVPRGDRRRHPRRARGFDANDPHTFAHPFYGGADARDLTTAAHRHEDRFRLRPLFEDLEPHRARAGDDPRMIEGRHDREVALRRFRSARVLRSADVVPAMITSAPCSRTRSTFTRGAFSGITITAGICIARATSATARP
jgi:hypothetical protein